MSLDNFENIIKEKFNNFGEKPPDYIFDNVKKDVINSNLKPNNNINKYLKVTGIIGVISVISIITLTNLNNKDLKNNNSETIIVKDSSIVMNNSNDASEKAISLLNNTKKNNNTSSKTEKTISKSVYGNSINIEISKGKIISSSNDLIIYKDENYYYIKSNNFGVKKISFSKDNINTNYIINFINPIEPINADNKNYSSNKSINDNQKDITPKQDFDVRFEVVSPTCYNSNGSIYTIVDGNNYSFIWNDNTKNKNRRNVKSGKYSVTVTNNDNISKSFDVNVGDSGIVIADFNHEELSLELNSTIFFVNKSKIDNIDISTNTKCTVFWDFGDGNTSSEINAEHVYYNPKKYTVKLKVISNAGCIDSIKYSDIIIPKTLIEIPNAFTPNGDGINDIFKLNVKSAKSFECVILDKSGKQIYRWNDSNLGWDGKINGNDYASDGIYYYVVKVMDSNNKNIEKTGFFYLFKNK